MPKLKKEKRAVTRKCHPLPKAQKNTGFNGFLAIIIFSQKNNKKTGLCASNITGG
jgi:hypothetical protein